MRRTVYGSLIASLGITSTSASRWASFGGHSSSHGGRGGHGGGGGGSASRRPSDILPTKDRFPPIAYDESDPRRRLAILVDGSRVSADAFRKLGPTIDSLGVPILHRVFDVELRPEWSEMVSRSGFEWFRVERFIPISMQMSADAFHISEFKAQNKIEAICYVCSELDRSIFDRLLQRLEGRGMNQYTLDELGLGQRYEVDGRKGNGAE